MPRHVLIIANPIAGGGRARRRAPELAAALQRLGLDAALFFTARAGDAAAHVRDPNLRPDVVAVLGGDGTVNEVLNGLPDPTVPLAVLPLGTANVLATELRLPRRPADLARLIADDSTVPAAIGVANGRRFLLFTGVGIDGATVRRLEEVRRGPLGKLRWTGPVWHTIRRWPIADLTVTTAEGERVERCTEVLITRVKNYGGIMTMPGRIRIDDGLLHVLCFRQRSRFAYACATVRALTATLRDGIDALHLTTRAVEVTAAGAVEVTAAGAVEVTGAAGGAAPWQIDGDLGGTTPLRVELAAGSANIFAPPIRAPVPAPAAQPEARRGAAAPPEASGSALVHAPHRRPGV